MISFAMLWEDVLKEQQYSESSPLMDSGEENENMQIIRTGLNLRGENNASFWHDFINLCSNPSGLANLLGVDEQKVATWAAKIQNALHEVERADKQHPTKEKEKQKMIPTGDNGAVIIPNQTRGSNAFV